MSMDRNAGAQAAESLRMLPLTHVGGSFVFEGTLSVGSLTGKQKDGRHFVHPRKKGVPI